MSLKTKLMEYQFETLMTAINGFANSYMTAKEETETAEEFLEKTIKSYIEFTAYDNIAYIADHFAETGQIPEAGADGLVQVPFSPTTKRFLSVVYLFAAEFVKNPEDFMVKIEREIRNSIIKQVREKARKATN